MSGWRQAVFLRQRRIDVIQRALSIILDAESWSPATPRRLYVGAADASSRGWTMILPELANFFLDRGGTSERRLSRLARELRCPAYEVDVRDPIATALYEVDDRGRTRISGAVTPAILAGDGETGGEPDEPEIASPVVGFGLLAVTDDIAARVAELAAAAARVSTDRGRATALADYLGAVAGFPAWTRHADEPITAGELIYEPPRILARDAARVTAPLPETRAAIVRTAPRAVPPPYDRRGRRPRSVARSRR